MTHSHDSKALSLARQVMALTRQEHLGGDVQLLAKIQCLFVEAMEYAAPQSFGNSEQLNSPVNQDDTRRMDWLVSKTVNVREPLVYGSRDLFWSQSITDGYEDYHATKLREQIDEAMLAAAPGKEG